MVIHNYQSSTTMFEKLVNAVMHNDTESGDCNEIRMRVYIVANYGTNIYYNDYETTHGK